MGPQKDLQRASGLGDSWCTLISQTERELGRSRRYSWARVESWSVEAWGVGDNERTGMADGKKVWRIGQGTRSPGEEREEQTSRLVGIEG